MTSKVTNFKVPAAFEPDPVGPPSLVFNEQEVSLSYMGKGENSYMRVMFEKFDSMRVSRGEYCPYEKHSPNEYYSIGCVENSEWLRERYEYESKHYKNAYEFGNDVNVMLKEFKHFLFEFHDEYVEVLASGLWFEKGSEPLAGKPRSDDHPLKREMKNFQKADEFEVANIRCELRRNIKTEDQLFEDAILCSQPLYEYHLHLDNQWRPWDQVRVKRQGEKIFSYLVSSLGKRLSSHEGVLSIDKAKEIIVPEINAVRKRRIEMGKGDN